MTDGYTALARRVAAMESEQRVPRGQRTRWKTWVAQRPSYPPGNVLSVVEMRRDEWFTHAAVPTRYPGHIVEPFEPGNMV